MRKFYFTNNTFKNCGVSHACDIKRTGAKYDVIVRGIILDREKVIYLRINNFSLYFGIEQKKAEYNFKNNFGACEGYLRRNFKGYKVLDSFSINKLPLQLQKDILNS